MRHLGLASLLVLPALGACGSDPLHSLPQKSPRPQGEVPGCGDGVQDPGEECDQGDANADGWSAARHCDTTCHWAPFCGDGIPNGDEACDDGDAAYDDWGSTP